MTQTALASEVSTPKDPILGSVGAAVALHAALIFGLGFVAIERTNAVPPSLEVVIQQIETETRPEDADYLSNVDADGGGESDERVRESSPFTSSEQIDNDGLAPTPMLESAPEPSEQRQPELLKQLFSDITTPTTDSAEQQADPKPNRSDQVIEHNLSVASMLAETRLELERYTQRPRVTYAHARMRASAAARYMDSWVSKVERIGNLNYPTQARRARLRGALILSVAIHKNGDLHEVLIKQSSGRQTLDEAAVSIVQQAAPFEPLTGDLADETDILYITRTWTFDSQSMISNE